MEAAEPSRNKENLQGNNLEVNGSEPGPSHQPGDLCRAVIGHAQICIRALPAAAGVTTYTHPWRHAPICAE